jgi:hypothetical protein
MSLPSRIIFAASMATCAALCIWVALAWGGPSERSMWILAVLCVAGALAVLVFRGRTRNEVVDFRVENAPTPTFRLINAESKEQEVWQLVLGETHCELIRPDGSLESRFRRSWAEIAIQLPGFVSGEHLGIATADWSGPEENEREVSPGEVLGAAKRVARWGDSEVPRHWFLAPKGLIREITDYRKQSLAQSGSEVARPIRLKARRDLASGILGLFIGGAILGFGVTQFLKSRARPNPNGQAPNRNRTRLPALGGFILFLALWRLGRGVALSRQAARLDRG